MELNPLKTLTEEKPKTRAMSAGVVGSIVEALNSVPASAVPSLLECIMTSTALSPSSLFDSLLHALSNRMLDDEAFQLATGTSTSVISSFITALCYLLKKSGTHPTALQSFIWKACLPALELIIKNTNNHQLLLNLILQQLTDVVIQSNSWEVIHTTLLPFALCSLRLSLTMPQNINQEEAIYHWTWPHTNPPSLPLPLSCHIITSLLLASFTTCQHPPAPLLWDTCNMATQMLSQTPDHRSAAIHLLLPYIFTIFTAHSSFQLSIHGKMHLLSRSSFLQKIFKCCQPLFSLGPLERRDAYAILSLYFSVFYLKENSQDIATCNAVPEFDIRAQSEFWDEIKRGLVDKAAFVRKHSLDMLKMSFSENVGRQRFTDFSEKQMHEHSSTPRGSTRRGQWAEKEAKSLGVGQICKFADADSSGQQRWDAFVLLYEMLEEYGTHLVEAAWNHQISILLHFPCPQLPRSDVTGGVHHSQMETLEGLFSWLAVLWERGLCHENPQVRCLIMQSLLSIDWKDHGICAELVPESFIIGPFILGLNDTVHHKEFGAKGVYSSKTMKDAITFVSQFCKGFSLRQRIAFMHNLSSRAKEESFGRSGLMAFSACIASVGSGVEWRKVCPHDVGHIDPSEGTSSHNCKADLLDTLRHVIESSKQHFNLNYRHQVCENILAAASTVICTCDVPLETLMHFISTVPPELTHYGGALRGNMQNWVSKCSETLSCDLHSNSSMTRTHVFNSLCNFPERFVECHSPDTIVTYDDGDLEAWEFEARRWARVLLLVLMDGECLEKVFKFFQNCGINICNQKSQRKWLPSKFLVLNLSLVQELQVMRMKSISCGIKVRSNTGSRVLESDQLFLTETSVIFEKFTFTFLFIMEELVLFAKSTCSTFWCSPVMASHLPSSVSGRLGGPSQRRLASCATTAVLDAILSMKTVASLSCWCAYDGSGNLVDFTFTFLWSFSMKVILSPKCDLESETGAEKSLAAYEALVPVVDVVASSMTPMLFCLIMASDKSFLPEVKDGHWMDNLLLRFLQNINELIAVGKLARSRRAILMNWKWLCLSSLLSILCGIIQNGAHLGDNTSFFSTASLKIIYSDLVGSLEKASESSVLPMLRCVRTVLELFSMGSVGSSVLSSDGLNTEMIWELVNSSWILHVSCNKRRVAHIAALLSSALHCFIFRVDRMHETTEYTQGPCKWFVGKIIDEGTKSPRTIRLAALHLTGLWLEYPRTIRYYIEELKLLSLYGSVAFDEDFESELAESHDAKTEVSFLAKGLDIELTEAFINSELYARVSVAVLFHELANLADKVGTTEETDDCCDAHFAGKAFLLKLLDSVVNDSDLAKELYKKNSGIHRRKVRAWQMICILSRFVGEDIVQQVTSSLHICLYRNNMPSVRQYLEIFAVQIYLKFPSLVEEQLCPIFRDYDMRPQALASYVFIAANIILHATEEVSRLRHLSELLPPITPLLTSHHHSLRGFTQLLVYKVLANVVPALNYKDSEIVPLEKMCFVDLKSYLEKNSDCVRLRTSMEGFLDSFDPNTSATPAGLFTARDEEVEFECVPTSLMEQVNTFLNDVREELRGSIAKDIVIISNESITAGKDCNHLNISPKFTVERLPPQVPKDISLDFQKKISLSKPERQYGDISSISECHDFSRQFVDLEKEDELLFQLLRSRNLAMEHMRASRQDFILVASLLDRIPNIAGLARTCEVFNASCLAVSDATIVRDKQFQLISVTAEKWVPITEVPVSSMKVFLKKKKQEGFSIMGLEQTANSIPLDQYAFPRKTVLVLGREKEGIPVDIIHILDACVEIPQLGVVRSLNVHVSGAIALWEYTRQHHPLQRN